jgi:hypothetical protein
MRARVFSLLVLAIGAGCGGDREGEATESGQLGGRAAAADSTVFGDDREGQSFSGPVTAPEVALLERLIDEYEELDVVMDALASPSWENPVQGAAWRGDRHEDVEKDRLKELLATEYHERYFPRTPEGAAAANSIARLPHSAGRRELANLVAGQHRRVAAMIENASPALTNPRVRAAVLKLHQDVRNELAED